MRRMLEDDRADHATRVAQLEVEKQLVAPRSASLKAKQIAVEDKEREVNAILENAEAMKDEVSGVGSYFRPSVVIVRPNSAVERMQRP